MGMKNGNNSAIWGLLFSYSLLLYENFISAGGSNYVTCIIFLNIVSTNIPTKKTFLSYTYFGKIFL